MALFETQSPLETGLLGGVLEASSDSVEIDDIDGSVILVNNAWCRFFDREKRDVIGARWDELDLEVAGPSALRDSWDRCISYGRSEGSLRLGWDGAVAVIVPYIRSLFRDPDGNPRAAITIFRSTPYPPLNHFRGADVEQLRSGKGLAALEHERKNVLTMIVLNVDLVSRVVEDRMVQQRLALVQAALKNSLDLLSELPQVLENEHFLMRQRTIERV